MDTFQQILDLDEDGTREFSRGMAWAYFSQVVNTFEDMDDALSVFTMIVSPQSFLIALQQREKRSGKTIEPWSLS